MSQASENRGVTDPAGRQNTTLALIVTNVSLKAYRAGVGFPVLVALFLEVMASRLVGTDQPL